MLAWRPRDLNLGYLPFMEGKGIAQYTSDPVFQKMLDEPDDSIALDQKRNLNTLIGLITLVNKYPGSGFFRKAQIRSPD